MNKSSALRFGGSFKPQSDTTHCVSYYYIPGGGNYELAESRIVYFNNEQAANMFSGACRNENLAEVFKYQKEETK